MLRRRSRASTGGRARSAAGRTRPAAVVWGAVIVLALVLGAVVCGVAFGAVSIPVARVACALVDLLPGVSLSCGTTETEVAIITQLRLPRVVLGLLVGALLACGGAAYQGVFRNPLADPYLLGVAAGAGLGAVLAIALGLADTGLLGVPGLAFAGAVLALAVTYLLGGTGRRSSPTTLILAGVAVASFLAAVQNFILQSRSDTLREAYSWMLGRLAVAGWSEVLVLLPYALFSLVVLVAYSRVLDVLSVGDEEATSLGLNPRTARLVVLAAASLGTAAAVSFSGLIGFVGIVVPHLVRLIVGHSYRRIVPLSIGIGAAGLVLADLAARTVLAPAELPIGVVTAFVGAPFFLLVLRLSRMDRR